MKNLTDDQLTAMTEQGKKKWENKRMWYDNSHYAPNLNGYVPEIDRPHMFQCMKCKSHYYQDQCPNCANTFFRVGESDGSYGFFCKRCERGFTSWTCKDCGCENPAERTLFLLDQVHSGPCFIATATFNDFNAPEVITLRQFRDNVLNHSLLGRTFIRLYYFVAPSIATVVSSSNVLKAASRFFLGRLVLFLQRKQSQ